MEIVSAERLSFYYPDAHKPALNDVSLSVRQGEFIVLCGASGSGKTTLLRHFKKELTPVGRCTGEIRYDGLPLAEVPDGRAAEEIGFVFQHPESQIVMDTVWHELAFSMENRGFDLVQMRKRLAEMANFFGLEPLMQKSVHDLSGGQTQLVNLASVLLLQPRLLLLDEPTSQLDPVASREFVHLLRRLNEEFGVTVILSEHRLEDVIPLADRLILMEGGQIKYDGTPSEVCRRISAEGDERDQLYVPSVTRLLVAMQAGTRHERAADTRDRDRDSASVPLTVREAVDALTALLSPMDRYEENDPEGSVTGRIQPLTEPSATDASMDTDAQVVWRGKEITFRYDKEGQDVLKKLTLEVHENELLAVLGGNGAGKSTLLQLMAGLRKPQRGKAAVVGKRKLGFLAQNPMLYFSSDSVAEEFSRAAAYAELRGAAATEAIAYWTTLFGLDGELLERHPHDLSGGQQQKLALALVLLPRPDILCIDEPTKGLDPLAKESFALQLHALRRAGMTIVMVTHDVEFAARHATRCALLYDGEITAEAAPAPFFGGNYFYTTAVNRAVRRQFPDAVTYEDVMSRWPDAASRS